LELNTVTDIKHIDIDISQQKLTLFQGTDIVTSYAVSTGKNGVGQLRGSECTPLGKHIVRAKIGQTAEENTVFVGRRETGEIFSESLREQYPQRDWILTRILWLSGVESGVNRSGDVDTMRRYIYIHGCPDSDSFSSPSSHGCVKMHNKDVMDLFDKIDVGIPVFLHQ